MSGCVCARARVCVCVCVCVCVRSWLDLVPDEIRAFLEEESGDLGRVFPQSR